MPTSPKNTKRTRKRFGRHAWNKAQIVWRYVWAKRASMTGLQSSGASGLLCPVMDCCSAIVISPMRSVMADTLGKYIAVFIDFEIIWCIVIELQSQHCAVCAARISLTRFSYRVLTQCLKEPGLRPARPGSPRTARRAPQPQNPNFWIIPNTIHSLIDN